VTTGEVESERRPEVVGERVGRDAQAVPFEPGTFRWGALCEPAMIAVGNSVAPFPARLWLDVMIIEINAALRAILDGVPVELRVSDGPPPPMKAEYRVVFGHGEGEAEAVVSLDRPACRALADALATELADSRGLGGLSPTETGLLDYIVLECVARVSRRVFPGSTPLIVQALLHAEELDDAAVPAHGSVSARVSVDSQAGLIQCSVRDWPTRLPPQAIHKAHGDASPSSERPVTLQLALPTIWLSREEFSAIEVGDVLLPGAMELSSLLEGGFVRTSSGWSIAGFRVLAETSSVIRVRIDEPQIDVDPTGLGPRPDERIGVRTVVGELPLTPERLAEWKGGEELEFRLSSEAPLTLCRGREIIGRGEWAYGVGELGIRVAGWSAELGRPEARP